MIVERWILGFMVGNKPRIILFGALIRTILHTGGNCLHKN